MKIIIKINCVSTKSGVISDLGFNLKLGEFDIDQNITLPKPKLIELVHHLEALDNEVIIETIDGTKVTICGDRPHTVGGYFRTDGDTDKQNDLLDLPTCN
jgi:hypothetical protein